MDDPKIQAQARKVLDRIREANLPDFLDCAVDDVNCHGRLWGDTPLHVVVVWGDVEAARALVNAGADVNARGEDGYTPLHEAVSFENIELVRLLLDAGANPDIKEERFGETPADIARDIGDPEILALFD